MKNTFFILLATLCTIPTLCGDEPTGDQNRERPIVVLKNGAVLNGKGTNYGEKVRVELTDGGEVVVKKDQVELMADSLEEAYHLRREKLMVDNVLSQIDLARWCYDQGLKPESAKHLRDAKKIDPTHPGIVRLEKKIRDQERVVDEELPAAEPGQTPVAGLKDKLKERVESARRDSRAATGDISPASKVQYNKTIQPILLGSCAASKCHHQSGDLKFRLSRATSQSQHQALIVKRNLQSVLARLNVNLPEESPLLENAVQPHSESMRGPPISISSEEFNLLVEWVIMATDDLKSSPAAVAARQAPPIGSMPKTNRPSVDSPLDEELDIPRKNSNPPTQDGAKMAAKPAKSSARSRGLKKAEQEEGSDPNDPSEFNQQYFPNRLPK